MDVKNESWNGCKGNVCIPEPLLFILCLVKDLTSLSTLE